MFWWYNENYKHLRKNINSMVWQIQQKKRMWEELSKQLSCFHHEISLLFLTCVSEEKFWRRNPQIPTKAVTNNNNNINFNASD